MSEKSRTEHSDDKRRQLLDAAERVYHRQRDLGLTVRRLAAEADTTSQTIYTYFGSRDAVIDAMYERAAADLERELDMADEKLRATDPADRAKALADFIGDYRCYFVKRPARFLMLTSGTGPDGTDSSRMAGLRKRFYEVIVAAYGPLRDGNAPATDADVLLAVTAINGFVQAEIDGFVEVEHDPELAFNDLARKLIDVPA